MENLSLLNEHDIITDLSCPADRKLIETLHLLDLDEQQITVVNIVVKNVKHCLLDPTVKAVKFLIHGVAGSGKSYVANKILQELTEIGQNFLSCAPTVTAVSCLSKGRTVHDLFMFDVGKKFASKNMAHNLKPLEGSKLLLFKRRLEFCDGIIIDDISFVSAKMMLCIDMRLQQAMNSMLPFGGKFIIALGNIYQLHSVFENSFFSSVLDNSNIVTKDTSERLDVIRLHDFVLIHLTDKKNGNLFSI